MNSLVNFATACNGEFKDACSAIQIQTRGLVDESNKEVVEMTLEVDYVKNCTTLYKMIEEQDWESIVNFMDTGYWIGSLWADRTPPAEQARTWVTRFDPEDPNRIKWSQLPLHLAVVLCAPLAVVRRLVDAYPKALKCTDDEHMLPFHLSMRHAASDEVVDYLLSSFPDAVNVKGKNNRSALECAMRSRKKARARMLTVFLEKNRTKDSADLEVARSQLQEKKRHLDQLHGQLTAIETAKTQVEDELAGKINELLDAKAELESKLEELRHEKDVLELKSAKLAGQMNQTKLFHEIETERKIAALESYKRELEAAERQIQEDETRLRSNLAIIEKRVGRSMATKDMDALKKEISTFQTYRLEHTRSRAMDDIQNLKVSIQEELQKCRGAHKEEILAIQRALEKLITCDTSDASDEEMADLRAEIDRLKAELRIKKDAQELRNDLASLKTSLQLHLESFFWHDKETTAELRKAVESLHESSLDKLDHTGLVRLRKEVTQLKMSVQEKELKKQAKKDLLDIQAMLADQILTAKGKTRVQLLEKKKAIDSIDNAGLDERSVEELVSLQIEMINLKESLKRNSALSQKKELVAALKKDLSIEISSAYGKHRQTLVALKKAVEGLEKSSDATQIRLDSLAKHRQTLEDLKKQRAEVKQIKEDIVKLQKQVNTSIKQCDGDAKQELTSIQRELDHLLTQKLEEMSRIEVEATKANVRSLKNKVMESKEEFFTKLEFESLKATLEQKIASSKGSALQEYIIMKQSLDEIDLENVHVKGQEGWRQLMAEIEEIKVDLIRKDLVVMKSDLMDQYAEVLDSKQKESFLRAAEAIKLEVLGSISLPGLLAMKKDAETYQKQASSTKKSLLRSFFRRSKKQQTTETAPATVPLFAEPDVQPIMPPRAPTADEISHTSSEPDSESNSSSPKVARSMSYGNVSGANLRSSSNADKLKSPSSVGSLARKSVASERKLPTSITVEQ